MIARSGSWWVIVAALAGLLVTARVQAGTVRTDTLHSVESPGGFDDSVDPTSTPIELDASDGDTTATSTVVRTDTSTQVCFLLDVDDPGNYAYASGFEEFELAENTRYRVRVSLAGIVNFLTLKLYDPNEMDDILSFEHDPDSGILTDPSVSFSAFLAPGIYVWEYAAGIDGIVGSAEGCFHSEAIPEPSTFVLASLIAGVGLAGAWLRRRRKPAA